jgi:hypothetical protein
MVTLDSSSGYYAQAIAAMFGDENSTLAEGLARVRMRVNEMTRGAQVPWHSSGIGPQFSLSERLAGTPERAESQDLDWLRSRPMSGLSAQNAYLAAVLRDTLDSYTDYLADRSGDPMAPSIRALLVVRREVLIWQRACGANGPEDFWSYLERYPEGPHADEARNMLRRLEVSTIAPRGFKIPEYDIPSPLPGEAESLVSQSLGLESPPPTPAELLGPAVVSSQNDASTKQGAIIANVDTSHRSRLSNAKQVGLLHSEGVARDLAAGLSAEKMPDWIYSNLASPPFEAALIDPKFSQFPYWATPGPLLRTGSILSPSEPALTGALDSLARSGIDGRAEPHDMSLTALRPSFSDAQANPSEVLRGRVPLPVARSTALARRQGSPNRAFLSRQMQPSSTSPRQGVPLNR